MPETGGMYVYLREGWGRPCAFLYGWAQLVLIRAAALGGISSVFGEYFLRVFGIDPAAHPATGPTISLPAPSSSPAVTNIVGVQLGALFAGISTVAKFGALALLVAGVVRCSAAAPARSFANFASHRRAGRCRPLRPGADLGDVGLRRLRRPDLRQRRGEGSAAQPAARHHHRHARDHRDLPAANAAYLYVNSDRAAGKSRG